MTVQGIDKARSLLSKLGSRYLGALIHGGNRTDFVEPWTDELLRWKRPVVYFDSTNEGGRLSRATSKTDRAFFRLFFDEPAAVALAVESLASRGHRVVGFPSVDRFLVPRSSRQTRNGTHKFSIDSLRVQTRGYWTTRRIAMAREHARKTHPNMTIHKVSQEEPFWDLQGVGRRFVSTFSSRIGPFLSRESGSVLPKSLRESLLRITPSFADLLSKQPTAILCLNDTIAYEYLQWFGTAGIAIPEHLSLLAFGNTSDSVVRPVSTIDFGFSRLGYLAAHILIDDIPVRADRNGNIAGECRLIDRGSVAKPRG